MSNKFLISLLVFGSLTTDLNAQSAIRMSVYDSISNTPVSYATIKVLNKNKGTYSGGDGSFEINADNGDSLLITCVGFASKVIVIEKASKKVWLTPIIRELIPVIVSNKPKTEISSGQIANKIDLTFHLSIFSEFALKVQLPESVTEYHITKILIKVKKINPNSPVKMHIYSPGKDDLPGEELLIQNLLLNNYKVKGGLLEVDIKGLDIYSNEKFLFVGFEWVSNSGKKIESPELGFMNSRTKSLTYTRTLIDPTYQWMPMPNIPMTHASGKKEVMYPNLIASIVIEN